MKRTTFGCLFVEDTRNEEGKEETDRGRKKQKDDNRRTRKNKEKQRTQRWPQHEKRHIQNNDSKQRTLIKQRPEKL